LSSAPSSATRRRTPARKIKEGGRLGRSRELEKRGLCAQKTVVWGSGQEER
jgi:hypothetical protein